MGGEPNTLLLGEAVKAKRYLWLCVANEIPFLSSYEKEKPRPEKLRIEICLQVLGFQRLALQYEKANPLSEESVWRERGGRRRGEEEEEEARGVGERRT